MRSLTDSPGDQISYLNTHKEGITLAIRVSPRASKNAIEEEHGGELRVRVTAPPVEAAANEAVVRLLADTLGCAPSAITLLRGKTARHKVFLVRGVPLESARSRLEHRKA
jgi:uncharacterized protein (TIGR00251 family)